MTYDEGEHNRRKNYKDRDSRDHDGEISEATERCDKDKYKQCDDEF